MLRRVAITVAAVLLLSVVFFFTVLAPVVDRLLNRVAGGALAAVPDSTQRFHDSLLVADLHADQLLWPRDLLERATHGHVDLPRLQDGNVALQVFSVVSKSPRGLNYERNDDKSDNTRLLAMASRWPIATWSSLRARSLHQSARLHDAEKRSGGALRIVRTGADVTRLLADRARGEKVVGAVLASEGLQILEGNLANVDTLYDAGYRILGLTHFFDNEVAGSAHGVAKGGLTPLGREVIKLMEQKRILVDVAHASQQTIDDVLAMALRPVIVSHTGVRMICPGTRNLSDDHLKKIGATGGVIGIGYWDAAVCDISPESIARSILHAANIAGIDHVGLGSDFDGSTTTRFHTGQLSQLTHALRSAGMSDADVRKVMGENVLRVLTEWLPE